MAQLRKQQQPKQTPAPRNDGAAKALIPAVVQVTTATHNERGQLVTRGGSGTIVHVEAGAAIVLTCRHVSDAVGARTTVKLPDGRTFEAEYLAHDKTETDLAAYSIVGDSLPYKSVADDSPASNAALVGIGYSDGTPRPRFGSYDRQYGDGPNEVGVSFLVNGGDSGGGVFSAGFLVGVINKRRSGNGPGPGVVITQAACKRFVDACCPLLRKRHPPTPGLTPGPTPVPPAPMPSPALDATLEAAQALAKARDLLIEIKADLAKAKAAPPSIPPAPQIGQQGPQGPQGPAGPPGADADIASLRAELIALRGQVAQQQATLKNIAGSFRVRVTPTQGAPPAQ